MNTDSVTIDVPGRPEPVSVLRAKIARLDVSEGPAPEASMLQSVPASAPASGQSAARWQIATAAVTL
jgi:hypothetical protein